MRRPTRLRCSRHRSRTWRRTRVRDRPWASNWVPGAASCPGWRVGHQAGVTPKTGPRHRKRLLAVSGWPLQHVVHQANLIAVDPVILRSARKHGIGDADMLHAYRNPIRAFEADALTMLVGADAAGRLLEVGVVTAEGIEFVVHAMPARPKFLR